MRVETQDGGLLDLLLKPLATARSLVPLAPRPAPVAVGAVMTHETSKPWPFGDLVDPFDPRHLSPREMAGRSFDLYAAGVLSFDEYSRLAFQAELHPAFDATIGALTGETAAPDRPRDFVAEWEERLTFERRYNPESAPRVAQTERIAQVLRRIDGAGTNLVV